MRIITPGKRPEDMVARSTCGQCRCVFEYAKKEATYKSDQRDGDFYIIACPECQTSLCISSKAFKYPQPDTTDER